MKVENGSFKRVVKYSKGEFGKIGLYLTVLELRYDFSIESHPTESVELCPLITSCVPGSFPFEIIQDIRIRYVGWT